MKLRTANKVFSRFGSDLRGVDRNIKLLCPKFIGRIPLVYYPEGISFKGKLSNSMVKPLSFVRCFSTTNVFVEKAVKVYTDLQNNQGSLVRENNKLAGVYM